jgi:hypothetical protein
VLGVLPVPAGAIVASYTSQISVLLIAFAWSGGLATTGIFVASKLSPTRAHLTCSRSFSTNYSATTIASSIRPIRVSCAPV